MGSSADDGSLDENGQYFPDTDLRRCKLAASHFAHTRDNGDLTAKTLTRLAQTISRQDKALADQILRCWGIR